MNEQILITFGIEDFKKIVSEIFSTEFRKLRLQEPEKPQEEKLLTTKRVAEKYQKSITTIQSWIKKGYIKAYRISRKNYFKDSEVMQSLNEIKRREI